MTNTTNNLTKKQQKMIDRIRDTLLYNANDRYEFQKNRPSEIKREKTELIDHTKIVSFVIELGGINDEGTMAAVICRDYRHFHIGPQGGVQLMNAKHVSKSRGFFNAIHAQTGY